MMYDACRCGYGTLLEANVQMVLVDVVVNFARGRLADVEGKDKHTLKLPSHRVQSKMRLDCFSSSLRLTPIERCRSFDASSNCVRYQKRIAVAVTPYLFY